MKMIAFLMAGLVVASLAATPCPTTVCSISSSDYCYEFNGSSNVIHINPCGKGQVCNVSAASFTSVIGNTSKSASCITPTNDDDDNTPATPSNILPGWACSSKDECASGTCTDGLCAGVAEGGECVPITGFTNGVEKDQNNMLCGQGLWCLDAPAASGSDDGDSTGKTCQKGTVGQTDTCTATSDCEGNYLCVSSDGTTDGAMKCMLTLVADASKAANDGGLTESGDCYHDWQCPNGYLCNEVGTVLSNNTCYPANSYSNSGIQYGSRCSQDNDCSPASCNICGVANSEGLGQCSSLPYGGTDNNSVNQGSYGVSFYNSQRSKNTSSTTYPCPAEYKESTETPTCFSNVYTSMMPTVPNPNMPAGSCYTSFLMTGSVFLKELSSGSDSDSDDSASTPQACAKVTCGNLGQNQCYSYAADTNTITLTACEAASKSNEVNSCPVVVNLTEPTAGTVECKTTTIPDSDDTDTTIKAYLYPAQTCSSSQECYSGNCSGGVCIGVGAGGKCAVMTNSSYAGQSDANKKIFCGAGLMCSSQSSTCTSGGSAGDTCSNSGDCAGYTNCVQGKCVALGSQPIQGYCEQDWDCAANLHCSVNRCINSEVYNQGGYASMCQSDDDCSPATCECVSAVAATPWNTEGAGLCGLLPDGTRGQTYLNKLRSDIGATTFACPLAYKTIPILQASASAKCPTSLIWGHADQLTTASCYKTWVGDSSYTTPASVPSGNSGNGNTGDDDDTDGGTTKKKSSSSGLLMSLMAVLALLINF